MIFILLMNAFKKLDYVCDIKTWVAGIFMYILFIWCACVCMFLFLVINNTDHELALETKTLLIQLKYFNSLIPLLVQLS